jgi:hypothetical protein
LNKLNFGIAIKPNHDFVLPQDVFSGVETPTEEKEKAGKQPAGNLREGSHGFFVYVPAFALFYPLERRELYPSALNSQTESSPLIMFGTFWIRGPCTAYIPPPCLNRFAKR